MNGPPGTSSSTSRSGTSPARPSQGSAASPTGSRGCRQEQDQFNADIAAGFNVGSDHLQNAFKNGAKAAEAELEKAFETFGTTFSDLLTSGLSGGATGFAQTASSLFNANVKTSMTTLFTQLGKSLFGGTANFKIGDVVNGQTLTTQDHRYSRPTRRQTRSPPRRFRASSR